jgi:hypothetical protein
MSAVLVVVSILVVAAVGATCFLVGRALGLRLTSSHYGGIGRIREIGELVALRVDCSEVAWASDPNGLLGRGRSLLARCDMVIEHRFNLRGMVIRTTGDGIELRLPAATVAVSHGAIELVHMQHGTVLGVPCRRIGAADINRLLAEARENANSRRQGMADDLAARAQDSARNLLLSYASIFAPAEKVRIIFTANAEATTASPPAGAAERLPVPADPVGARRRLASSARAAIVACTRWPWNEMTLARLMSR